jgi:16S rRNA (cytosine967-C5)-methyltransferase
MVKRERKAPRRPARPAPAEKRPKKVEDADTPGFAARKIAAEALFAILHRGRPLDELLDSAIGVEGLSALPDRDRALVRMLTATVLRRLGTLRALLAGMMEKGLPKDVPQIEIALLLGTAQILFLDVPDHAAVDLSVRLASAPRNARYAGLVNAVLRRMTREGRERLAALDPSLDTPAWLRERWISHYGAATAASIMEAHRLEPPLDLTAKSDAAAWAEKLGGALLPNGTIRVASAGMVTALPGFSDGTWWVQDVAASMPARLLGNVAGLSVADLCAAPGGKTAQLAAAAAKVVAVDRSEARMKRLRENLARLSLVAETVVADASKWDAGPFDAVLLDAPCSATGTIRRHPDIPWQKRLADIAALTGLQSRLLDRAAKLTKPGGLLVYATCSLEPEEGEQQIESFLARNVDFVRAPIEPSELEGFAEFLSPMGDMRSLPFHVPNGDSRLSGCDGFYSARLRRIS